MKLLKKASIFYKKSKNFNFSVFFYINLFIFSNPRKFIIDFTPQFLYNKNVVRCA